MLRRTVRSFAGTPATFFAKDIIDKSGAEKKPLPSMIAQIGRHGSVPEAIAPLMVEVDYEKDTWKEPVLRDYGKIAMQPQIGALHYGLSCFEDFNVFRSESDTSSDKHIHGMYVFRPDVHMERFQQSCEQMAFEKFDKDELWQLFKDYIGRMGLQCLPQHRNHTLRVRISMIGTSTTLIANRSDQCKLYMTATLADWTPPSIYRAVMGSLNLRRSFKGGTGEHSTSGNYVNQIFAENMAQQKGFDTVLFIGDGEKLSCVGSSNLIIVWQHPTRGREIITPRTEGMTRRTVTMDTFCHMIRTSKSFEGEVAEDDVTVNDLHDALKEGRVEELIACGGEHVLTNITHITVRGTNFTLPANSFKQTAKIYMPELMRSIRQQHDVQQDQTLTGDWSTKVWQHEQ